MSESYDKLKAQWDAMLHKQSDAKDREIGDLKEENKQLRDALQLLYDETADYIRINNLGDVHHNESMQRARAALEGNK